MEFFETQSHEREDKLYIVTHASLTPGYQTAQVAHAATEFAFRQPDHFHRWYTNSRYVIALQVEDSSTLEALIAEAQMNGLIVEPFYEPDLNFEVTAVAFAPSQDTPEFLSALSLAGSHVNTSGVDKHSYAENYSVDTLF